MQISDENLHHVREVMDEVFGIDNFSAVIPFVKTSGQSSPTGTTDVIASVADYLLWYARDKERLTFNRIYLPKADKTVEEQYDWVEFSDGNSRRLTVREMQGENAICGRRFMAGDASSRTGVESTRFPIKIAGQEYRPAGIRGWLTNADGIERLRAANRLLVIGNSLRVKRFLDDYAFTPLANFWSDTVISGFGESRLYVVQTSTRVIERCILMTTDPGDLVLDPTCGSGTTAYVAEQWGRRWITIDTSRVPLALARQRLLTATFPWYELKDDNRGTPLERQEQEIENAFFAMMHPPCGSVKLSRHLNGIPAVG